MKRILTIFFLIGFILWATSYVLAGEYIGCFKDQGDPLSTKGRDLNGYIVQHSKMTVEKCIDICRQRGFKYAGVQYSRFCFCGNRYGTFGRANNCNMRCSGNPTEFCGGPWANSVYKVVGIITNNGNSWANTPQLEYNTDRPGLDFKNFCLPRPDPRLCKQACDRSPNCKAWTYVKPNTIQGPRPRCWLKYGIPSPVKSPYCISGVKKIKKPYIVPKPPIVHRPINLTGTWKCDDGGTYYIRQIGRSIWWYGERSPNSPQWSNVAFGKIQGNTLRLKWADVPKGQNLLNGVLVLKIVSPNRLKAIRKTGGFGGNNWSRY